MSVAASVQDHVNFISLLASLRISVQYSAPYIMVEDMCVSVCLCGMLHVDLCVCVCVYVCLYGTVCVCVCVS